MTGEPRYLGAAATHARLWVDAILELGEAPQGLSADGAITDVDAESYAKYRKFAGEAGDLSVKIDRAENILASDGISALLALWQRTGDTDFRTAAETLLSQLVHELPDPGRRPRRRRRALLPQGDGRHALRSDRARCGVGRRCRSDPRDRHRRADQASRARPRDRQARRSALLVRKRHAAHGQPHHARGGRARSRTTKRSARSPSILRAPVSCSAATSFRTADITAARLEVSARSRAVTGVTTTPAWSPPCSSRRSPAPESQPTLIAPKRTLSPRSRVFGGSLHCGRITTPAGPHSCAFFCTAPCR